MKWTHEELASITNGQWDCPTPKNLTVESLSTDTRAIKPGDFFVALKGEHFDAHNFLTQAIAAGASSLMVRRDATLPQDLLGTIPILKVDDTLHAMGDLASAWHKRCRAQRISVVGSCGKTTTKEMLAAILSSVEPTHYSRGNFNNRIGLPLSLFTLRESDRWSVLELGMNEPGELTRLTQIADPDLLLLLRVGTAHIGQFGSLDALIDAKTEAVRALRPDVPILYDAASENTRRIIHQWGGEHPLLSFCMGDSADICAQNIKADKAGGYTFDLIIGGLTHRARLPIFGRFNVANAVAAAAAAHIVGVDPQAIINALENFTPASMRSEQRTVGGVDLLVDCYNANPDSMRAMLGSISETEASARRVFLVLGHMLELGDESEAAHREIGRIALTTPHEEIFLFGTDMRPGLDELMRAGDNARLYTSLEELTERLISQMRPGDLIAFKGSRGAQLEKVVRAVEQHLAPETQTEK